MTTTTYKVIASALNLRDKPGLHGQVVLVLERNATVVATTSVDSNGWIGVIVASGRSGFVALKFLQQDLTASQPPAPQALQSIDVELKDRDMSKLHPLFRAKVNEVLKACKDSGLPFRVFEAYRSPERQEYLYQQGRTRFDGGIVTNARAWGSFHQYGLAVDFVLFEGGRWSWDDSGLRRPYWAKLQELVAAMDLRALSFEKPHAEWKANLSDLQAGTLPDQGDESWHDNMEAAVARWKSRKPAAPDLGSLERPQLPT